LVPWFLRNAERLRADRKLVGAAYPTLQWRISKPRGLARLEGPLLFTPECGVHGRVEIEVRFPASYPKKEPTTYDAKRQFDRAAKDGHINADGSCCLWLPSESTWDPADPRALRSYLDQVAVFFHRRLVFEAGRERRWPGQERDHGGAGFLEYVREKLGSKIRLADFMPVLQASGDLDPYAPCPCGSGKKYKWCHRDALEAALAKVDRTALQEAITADE
jgi:hypothetical protein